MPIVGVIENMSGFTTEEGRHYDLFGKGGGQELADDLGVPLLGQVPLQADLTRQADEGQLVVLDQPESPAGAALAAVVGEVLKHAGGKTVQLPVIT